jgi:hypothetical protein
MIKQPTKKRIILDMRLDKIAAVDRPCQQHALALVIKRAHIPAPNKAISFVGDPFEIGKALGHVQKDIDRNDACVAEMVKRGGVTRLRAMELAREEYPAEFEALGEG